MSRVFTIQFAFKGKSYTALVSFMSQEKDICYQVRYLNDEVQKLIPGNKMLVSLSGVENPRLENKFANDLICKTTEVVKDYLQSSENQQS